MTQLKQHFFQRSFGIRTQCVENSKSLTSDFVKLFFLNHVHVYATDNRQAMKKVRS